MTAKNIVSIATLALAVAAVVLPMSGAAMAGGYGYGSQSGWSGYQAHTPKRQKVRRHAYAGSNRHLAWCYNRYRSYRLMDNSFQPYHGPRQECLSPYEQERRALFVGYPGEAPEILFRDQAVSGQDRTERDAFGNLSESGPVDTAIAGGNGGKSDEFGNLSEQAAVSGTVAPAVESQPGTNATQAPVEPAVNATPAATQAPAVEPVFTETPAPSTEADSQVSAETDATTQTAKAVPLEEVGEQSENPASAD